MVPVFCELLLWLLGLCIGSFLNVVVYRLSVGLSIADPPRSFCPLCRAGIAWYDNLPVLSWFLLRGRCRHCRAPISVQYPLVEALTGLTFVLVYHLLAVDGARAALGPALLPRDLPLILAWVVLAAGLVACGALDIVSYSVDIRVTNAVLALGVALAAAWPRAEYLVPQARSPLAAAAVVAFVAGAVAMWLRERRHPEVADEGESAPDHHEVHPPGTPGTRIGGPVAALAMVGLALWMIGLSSSPHGVTTLAGDFVIPAALLGMFAVVAVAGGQQRPVDDAIRSVIEEEQPRARRVAAGELIWLAPALLLGVVTYLVVWQLPAFGLGWENIVRWSPGGRFAPLAGAVYALRGVALAAAAGWLLRIVFTLIYGREAFGVGDIYILAAAGATAGGDVALVGLLLSVGIALLGWLVGLLLKSTVMIPFGPWLALGFFLALWWDRPATRLLDAYGSGLRTAWSDRPELLAMAGGLMLVGSAAAIVLSRLVRRWVLPDEPEDDDPGNDADAAEQT